MLIIESHLNIVWQRLQKCADIYSEYNGDYWLMSLHERPDLLFKKKMRISLEQQTWFSIRSQNIVGSTLD